MIFAALLPLAIPAAAHAFPGQGQRLGGVEAQGPATRSITALHHNPAMLAGIGGTGIHSSLSSGLDQRWIRRYTVDANGTPGAEPGPRVTLLNPTFDYFIGFNVALDPIAFGIGVYTLGNTYRLQSADTLRYHLAPEFDVLPIACDSQSDSCPLNGGAATMRTDLTAAIAWNVLSTLKIGLAIHLPRLRTRFAYDNSTELADPKVGGPDCNRVEDPNCTERLGFSGVTRWLPGTATRPSGIDIVLTVGLAYDVTRRITIGARYRTRPLLSGGEITIAGDGLVCTPTSDDDATTVLPSCSNAPKIDAFVTQRMSREAALGAAFILGRSKQWRLDSNFYWIDLCNDIAGEGAGVVNCGDPGSQRINLINRDPGSVVLPETTRYRGLQDMFGVDLFTTYRVRSNIALTFAGHLSSPAVRRAAMSASNSDGWRVGLSLGTILRVRQSNFQLIPGYGVDLYLPSNVDAATASFVPAAGRTFLENHDDINAESANVVLDGRARPSNAGRYTGLVHTFTLGLRWAERGLGVER